MRKAWRVIAQTRDEESEQLCDRLRKRRNELQELDDVTERYDELVNDQSVALPKFGGVTAPPTVIVPRSRSGSPKGSTSPVKPAVTEAKISRKEVERIVASECSCGMW